ncbi:hypothetical protein [Candidatus Magnetaquicoccus inordinatus]|uniref:hypothetical protein n=1 Tax=Candidatus Magnetaquicoccus inordinatus TaxID=2496818 RepID=UPI00102CC4D2|nr:hypothetical protein [Candidatus Magnetaquicoccus inordinatus]
MAWVRTPFSGGSKIPEDVKRRVSKRILDCAESNFSGRYKRIAIRFKMQFCYIDAYAENEDYPTHLCRLRYFNEESWGAALYAYSSEKYEDTFFMSFDGFVKPEDAFLQAATLYIG